jgi:hypothetical protein
MKFGKSLEQESVQEWRSKYINYRDLKKQISVIEKLQDLTDEALHHGGVNPISHSEKGLVIQNDLQKGATMRVHTVLKSNSLHTGFETSSSSPVTNSPRRDSDSYGDTSIPSPSKPPVVSENGYLPIVKESEYEAGSPLGSTFSPSPSSDSCPMALQSTNLLKHKDQERSPSEMLLLDTRFPSATAEKPPSLSKLIIPSLEKFPTLPKSVGSDVPFSPPFTLERSRTLERASQMLRNRRDSIRSLFSPKRKFSTTSSNRTLLLIFLLE